MKNTISTLHFSLRPVLAALSLAFFCSAGYGQITEPFVSGYSEREIKIAFFTSERGMVQTVNVTENVGELEWSYNQTLGIPVGRRYTRNGIVVTLPDGVNQNELKIEYDFASYPEPGIFGLEVEIKDKGRAYSKMILKINVVVYQSYAPSWVAAGTVGGGYVAGRWGGAIGIDILKGFQLGKTQRLALLAGFFSNAYPGSESGNGYLALAWGGTVGLDYTTMDGFNFKFLGKAGRGNADLTVEKDTGNNDWGYIMGASAFAGFIIDQFEIGLRTEVLVDPYSYNKGQLFSMIGVGAGYRW